MHPKPTVSLLLVAALAIVAPVEALAQADALVFVHCTGPCKIKIRGSHGRELSPSDWVFERLPPGNWRLAASHGFSGGWVDVPSIGTVRVEVSRGVMKVDGRDADRSRAQILDDAREVQREGRGPRLRFGATLSWSPIAKVQSWNADQSYFAQNSSRGEEGLFDLGVHLRLGVQFTEVVALYFQASAILGNTVRYQLGLFGGQSGPETNYWVPIHATSAVFELTVLDHLQVGVGPALFIGAFDGQPIGTGLVGAGGTARLAIAPKPRCTEDARLAFTLGLVGHLGYFPGGGRFLDLGVALGVDLF